MLYDFLKNGILNGIRVGDSQKQLISYLGRPNKIYSLDENITYLYSYDEFEITLFKNTVALINIFLHEELNLFNNSKDGVKTIRNNDPMHKVISALNDIEIKWEFNKELCFTKQIGIKTIGGVNLIFDFEENIFGLIGKIGAN